MPGAPGCPSAGGGAHAGAQVGGVVRVAGLGAVVERVDGGGQQVGVDVEVRGRVSSICLV